MEQTCGIFNDNSIPVEECSLFENSIKYFLKRQKKRLEKNHGPIQNPYTEEAMSLTKHAINILRTLYIKRNSLSNSIKAFEKICTESIETVKEILLSSVCRMHNEKTSSSSLSTLQQKNVQEILTHLFVQYIRIRDGFVLLTSGECRHDGDSKLAKNETRFPSRLNELSKCRDGYTSLFSSNLGYSGYGWDEFYNEKVGVRRVLLDTLRKCSTKMQQKMSPETEKRFTECPTASSARETIWEKLMEANNGAAELFEASFDRHQDEMKELQSRLETVRSKLFIQGMEKVLVSHGVSARLLMVTEDKFERLDLQIQSGGVFLSIQRQGDTFRGKDSRGALPSNLSVADWFKIMKVHDHLKNKLSVFEDSTKRGDTQKKNPTHGTKRKRIIDDSDEEDDEDITNCLKVTVERIKSQNHGVTASSIHGIKRQLGVDANQLERGREDLEAEEIGTKKAAFADEVIRGEELTIQNIRYSEKIAELNEEILTQEENVHMFRSAYKMRTTTAVTSKENDNDEAWDVRESLRFSLMSLGCLLLEFHDLTKGDQKSHESFILRKAEACFRESIKVIEELVQMTESCYVKSKNEFQLRERSNLLCNGRAFANLGKTYFEQAELMSGTMNNKTEKKHLFSKISRAVKCLKRAETDALALRKAASTKMDIDTNNNNEDDVNINMYERRKRIDLLDTYSLLSMIWRHQADSALKLSKDEVCLERLRKSSGLSDFNATTIIYSKEEETMSEVEEIEAKANLMLQQYCGACVLVDIASSMSNRALKINTKNPTSKIVDYLSSTIFDAYNQAAKLSELLENIAKGSKSIEDMKFQFDIQSSVSIQKLRDNAMALHQQKRTVDLSLFSLRAKESRIPIPNLPRNDLFPQNENYNKSKGTICFDVSSLRTRKQKSNTNDFQGTEEEEEKRKEDLHQEFNDTFANFGMEDHDNYVGDGESFDDVFGQTKIEHRKWGDERLEESEVNIYPACAPQGLPEEF